MNKHRILVLLLLVITGSSLSGQNTIAADTIAAKGGLRINVGALKHTFTTATKVVNAASTHLQIPSAKAVWDALTANLVNLSGGSGVTITGTPPNLTISINDVSATNEGTLGVGAGGASSSTLLSNTTGSNPVTINVAGPVAIAESTSSNGGSITITVTEAQTLSLTGQTLAISGGNSVTLPVIAVAAGTGISVSPSGGTYTVTNTGDLSATNEGTLGVSAGTSTTAVLTSNTSGATGVTFAAGTGISITETTSANGGTITISASGGTAWLLGGNTLGANNSIGSNDNFSVSIETNGINRVWVANTGQVTIGATALTTYALNINGLQGGGGLFVDGGTGLVGPTFASFRGSGSGSTAYVADYQLNIISGNVLAYIANTATTGTGSAVMSLNVNSGASGDPVYYAGVSGGGGWYFGADNSATGDPFRITNGSNLGAVATGVTILSDGKFGVGTLTPGTTGDFFGSDAISIPSGPSGNRPTNARPHLRYNSSFGGFEAYDPNKSAWFRLSALSTPSVTTGGAAGTGASVVFASGSGIAASNDCSGTIDLTTGTSTGVGTLLTLTFFEPYNGTSTWVSLDAGNDIATEQRNFYSSQAASNTQFTIRARTPLNPSVTYRIKYNVRSY